MENIRSKFADQMNHLKTDYTETFMDSLIKIKVTLILLFIMITIIYLMQESQLINSGNIHVYTMLHSKEDLKKLVTVASLDAIFGTISFIFILGSRGGMPNLIFSIGDRFKEILLVATILFMFRFSQESSGFNRWLSPNAEVYDKLDEIQIDGMEQKAENAKFKILSEEGKTVSEEQHDAIVSAIKARYNANISKFDKTSQDMYASPFGLALEKTAMGGITLFVIYHTIKIFMSSFYGYTSGEHSLESDGISSPQFMVELLVMFVFNSIPSLLAPHIYGEKYDSEGVIMGVGMGGASVILHVLFQYAGLYSGLSE